MFTPMDYSNYTVYFTNHTEIEHKHFRFCAAQQEKSYINLTKLKKQTSSFVIGHRAAVK